MDPKHPSLSPSAVAERRRQAGLSQAMLARKTGVSQASISLYEASIRDLMGGALLKLDAALPPLPPGSEAVSRGLGGGAE